MTQRILFARSNKKDWEVSGGKNHYKLNPAAFGTRVPEHAFCILRFDRAKDQCHWRKQDPNGSPHQNEFTTIQPSGPSHAKPTKNQRHGQESRDKQTKSRHDTFASEEKSLSWVANNTSRCMSPLSKAARNHTEAARMRPLPTCTELHDFLDKVIYR